MRGEPYTACPDNSFSVSIRLPTTTLPSNPSASEPDKHRPDHRLANHSVLGVQYAAVLCVFAFAGYLLDGWLGWSPWCLVAGVALGFFAATYSLLRHVPPVKPASRNSK